jgi:hypothetical protein
VTKVVGVFVRFRAPLQQCMHCAHAYAACAASAPELRPVCSLVGGYARLTSMGHPLITLTFLGVIPRVHTRTIAIVNHP